MSRHNVALSSAIWWKTANESNPRRQKGSRSPQYLIKVSNILLVLLGFYSLIRGNTIIRMHLPIMVSCCFCYSDIAEVTREPCCLLRMLVFLFYNIIIIACFFMYELPRFRRSILKTTCKVLFDASSDEECRLEDDIASENDDHGSVHPRRMT